MNISIFRTSIGMPKIENVTRGGKSHSELLTDYQVKELRSTVMHRLYIYSHMCKTKKIPQNLFNN